MPATFSLEVVYCVRGFDLGVGVDKGATERCRRAALRALGSYAGLLLGLALFGLACGAGSGGDEQRFPEKPIRIVVYTGPGGLIDVTARRFAVAAGRVVDATFVVENKPGAGGLVAMQETLRAPADGYTLYAGTGSNVAKLVETGRSASFAELQWVAGLMADPECLIVRRSSELSSWDALLADAQARPGEQLWLGPAAGGLDHVMALKVWERAGIKARWIPYKSGGKALAALLGGHGAVYVGNPGEVQGNPELKVVAVSAPKRLAAFPDAPTFTELGLPGLERETMWRGFALRSGTPPGPRAWYDELFRQVARDPSWRTYWEKSGIDPSYLGPAEMGAQVARERGELERYLATLSLGARDTQQGTLARLSSQWTGGLAMALLTLLGLAAWALITRGRGLRSLGSVAVPLLLLSLGLVLLLATLAFPERGDGAGPAALPRLWLGLLVPVALVLLLQAIRAGFTVDSSSELPGIHRRGPLLLLLLAAYVMGLWGLGYFVSTALFLVLGLILLGERRPLVWLALSGGWVGLAWLVFARTLDVPLPQPALLQLFTGGAS